MICDSRFRLRAAKMAPGNATVGSGPAYSVEGYAVCATQSRVLENSIEKVAIYVDDAGGPTHAARQLADGTWTSKLGEWEDIQHNTLEAMEDSGGLGLGYGKVALVLRRVRI
jgi:hypothetical protein